MLALLAILIAANVIVGHLRLRKDLTEDRIYTLSDGSRDIVKKLEHPVTLKLFFSSSSSEVPDFLKTYAMPGGGSFEGVRTGRQRPDRCGKVRPQTGLGRRGTGGPLRHRRPEREHDGSPIYFGLAAVCGDAEASIPSLNPQTDRLLEYNLTRMIYRVANPKKPVLGVLSALPVLGSRPMPFMMPGQTPPQQPPWVAFRDLKQDYDVREIEPAAEEIPPDVDVLIVVHPKGVSDKTQYALDQFVLRGGRLLAFVDPFSLVDAEGSRSQPFGFSPASSDLGKLFTAWGVKYDPGKVVVDIGSTTRVRGQNNQAEDSPLYLSLTPSNMSSNDVPTASLQSVLMGYAGSFSGDGAPGLTVTPLLTSSPRSDLVDAMMAQAGGPDAVLRHFKSGMKPLTLAMRLHGKFKTAFPEGKPKAEGATNETAQAEDAFALKESAKDTTVILVADVDMLFDAFWVRSLNFFGSTAYEPFNDNVSFLNNAIEQLAGSADFTRVRTRGKTTRPFTRVLDLQRQAEQQWIDEETMLQDKLEQTQKRLDEMQVQKQDSQRYILSPQQKKEVEAVKQEITNTQHRLKEVRRNLREGIERLGAEVKAVDILLMPILVSLGGLGFWLFRRARTRK